MKKKVFYSVTIPILAVLLFSAGILYSYSKNTDTFLGLYTSARSAVFDVRIDGKPSDTVSFKAYATTKLSDIERSGNTYLPHSFVPGAYQTHSISITNNSETEVDCFLTVTRRNHDERIFFVLLPETENILEALYTPEDISTPKNVRQFLESVSFSNGRLAVGESKNFTMVIWSEHDAVYPDGNGDGIADEDGRKLSELTNGIPAEQFTLSFSFEQSD